jgi:hypothetical protein
MSRSFKKLFFFVVVMISLPLSGCQTIGDKGQAVKDPPAIGKRMDLDDALDAAIEFGGDTLTQVKQLISDRKEWSAAQKYVGKRIESDAETLSNSELINALHLYQVCPDEPKLAIFKMLLQSERPIARVLAWNLAASRPSRNIAQAVDDELTIRISNSTEDEVLIPQMANAIQANQVKTAYSLVRQGLMKSGEEAFAKAMIALHPKQASNDFLDYLGTASIEDLRQLNQNTVNLYTCMVVMRHMLAFPPSMNHPNFQQLFLYSVSRNKSLSDLANMALESYLPQYRKSLAFILSQLPEFIQVAYVENARAAMTPTVSRLLSELKEISSHDDVVEEIREAKL